jgi:hypothetical protein
VSKHQRCADDDLDSMETDDTLCMEASDKRVRFGGSASALRVALGSQLAPAKLCEHGPQGVQGQTAHRKSSTCNEVGCAVHGHWPLAQRAVQTPRAIIN